MTCNENNNNNNIKMYKDISNAEYDYVIFGTSLVESTLSAYLAKLQKKILHIEVSKSYGGDCKNLNLRELESCKPHY